MTIDHDAIAAKVRQDNTLGLNMCAAYLDLYDEVTRLRLRAAHAEHTTDAAISEVRRLEAERDALRAALESIANNTCCDGCREAALVARAALKGGDQ